MKNRPYVLPMVVIVAALSIKLGYLFFAFPDPSSAGRLSIDELYHYNWGALIASGDILANAPYFRAPLYPFFLGFLLAVSGKSLVFVRLIQLLLGGLIVFSTYRLAERFAERRSALFCAALLILYPVMTYFEGELLLDFLFSLFAVMTVHFLIDDRRERPVIVGLFFGLAALTRPTILVFLPIIIVYYLYRKSNQMRTHRIRSALIFFTTLVVIISPVTIVNGVYSGQFILISYQGGINFYIGNNPDADGVTSNLPPFGSDWTLEDASYVVSRETGEERSFASQSSFWYKKGLRFIADHPGQFAGLFVRKLAFLFSGIEISNNRPLAEAVFDNPLLSKLPIRFSLLVALAILPLFLANRNRQQMYLLYAMIILYAVVISLFFVSSRFRLPMVPFVAILSGWGISSLWETIARRNIGYRLFFAIVGAGAVFVSSTTAFPSRAFDNPDQALFLRGNQALRQGEYRLAAARFDSLIQRRREFKNAYLNLGIAYLKIGMADRAADAFRSEIESNPTSAEAFNNLAVMYLLDNNADSARYYARRALEIKPYYTEAAVNFLRSTDAVTDASDARDIEQVRRSIRTVNDDEPAYLFEEALYLTNRGRIDEAISNHLKIVELYENRPPSASFEPAFQNRASRNYRPLALYQLGYLYGRSGQFEQSIVFSRRAIDVDPDLKAAYMNLITAYRSSGRTRLADSVEAVFRSRWPESSTP